LTRSNKVMEGRGMTPPFNVKQEFRAPHPAVFGHFHHG